MTKLAHSLAHFPFGLFIAFVLAAVPLFLALGERQFAFGDAVAKINPQGDDRKTLCFKLSLQLVDLFLTEEKFPRTERSVVKWPSREIFADVQIHEPDFAAADQGVGVAQVGLALTKGFHFG